MANHRIILCDGTEQYLLSQELDAYFEHSLHNANMSHPEF